jgi:hypothetical protein
MHVAAGSTLLYEKLLLAKISQQAPTDVGGLSVQGHRRWV